jgi:glycosyltransferase involved in cell wall biosynthesis
LLPISFENYARQIQADIVHVHDSHAHTFAWLAAQYFGMQTPIVVSRRVDFPVKNKRTSHLKYNHPSVKAIICVSEKIKEITAPAIQNQEVLKVVYSGIDLKRFPYSNTDILHREFHLPEDQLIIGNIAAIAPHKDYFTFVDTVALLVKTGLNARYFIIGGDGGEQGMVERHIQEKGLGDHIILTGFRTDIPQIFPELDVLLFTSKTEGLGTTVLDAFACGVPVVATRGGGIPEMVEHEATGLLADVGDAEGLAREVTRLVQNDRLRQQLVTQGAIRLIQFTKNATARKTFNIYQSLPTPASG